MSSLSLVPRGATVSASFPAAWSPSVLATRATGRGLLPGRRSSHSGWNRSNWSGVKLSRASSSTQCDSALSWNNPLHSYFHAWLGAPLSSKVAPVSSLFPMQPGQTNLRKHVGILPVVRRKVLFLSLIPFSHESCALIALLGSSALVRRCLSLSTDLSIAHGLAWLASPLLRWSCSLPSPV